MSTFAILLLCVQACLIQTVFSQCGCGLASAPIIAPSYGLVAGPKPSLGLGMGAAGAYGGVGTGDVAVSGKLGVTGTTAIAGTVPIIGAVSFGGTVYARGSGVITGGCVGGCGCGF